MKNILLLGSGISVAPLCDYLGERGHHITLASRNEITAKKIISQQSNQSFHRINVSLSEPDNPTLSSLIKASDIVVSFLPGPYQPIVTKYCLEHSVSLVMTCHIGYLFKTQQEFEQLDQRAKNRGIAIVAEAGTDPGFGSMVGKKLIDDVHAKGGEIIDLWYHVGVLPYNPDVNPFSYKCFWAPKKALLASVKIKDGSGDWIKNSQRFKIPGDRVYSETIKVDIPGIGTFESRPNSDSGAYLYPKVYGIEDVRNFYHGTLRYPGWGEMFQGLIDLGFSDTEQRPELLHKTYREVVQSLCGTSTDADVEAQVAQKLNISTDHPVIQNYRWLGLFDNQAIIPPKDKISYCDIVSDLLVEKLGRHEEGDMEKDQIIMYYDILVQYPDNKERVTSVTNLSAQPGDKHSICATLTSKTAAIIADKIVQGLIDIPGLNYPTIPKIYEPVLKEYENEGIVSGKTVLEV